MDLGNHTSGNFCGLKCDHCPQIGQARVEPSKTYSNEAVIGECKIDHNAEWARTRDDLLTQDTQANRSGFAHDLALNRNCIVLGCYLL